MVNNASSSAKIPLLVYKANKACPSEEELKRRDALVPSESMEDLPTAKVILDVSRHKTFKLTII